MKIHRTFLALLAMCVPVLAQQTPAPAAPAVPTVPSDAPGLRVRGLAFQLDAAPTDVFAHDAAGDGRVQGVKLDVKSYLNHEFSVLPIKGDNLVFTKSADPAGIKDTANLVAKAKLPANFKTGIFMFLPGSGKPGDPMFRVLVIQDSKSEFPPGSIKVLNLSAQAIRIQLEKEVFDFKSGETKVIEDPPVSANQNSGMIGFYFRDKQWHRFASTNWPHPGEKRVIQVMFENPRTKEVEIRGVRDVSGSPL
jgi:hypothetical protein